MEDAKHLGMSVLTGQKTAALHFGFKGFASLKINYFDPMGEPLPDIPNGEPFFRIRYLESKKNIETASKKEVRYAQLPDTLPCVYFPRFPTLDWAETCLDTSTAIVFTEGELKAAKAVKEGFPTVGLGGVHNWRALDKGVEWVHSLEYIRLLRRNVYLCFDSDYRTNPAVCAALRGFGEELVRRGAFVRIVSLPDLSEEKDGKTGLDDFLVAEGRHCADSFEELLKRSEPFGLWRPLWHFNDTFCYIRNPGLIIDQEELTKTSPEAFKGHLAAHVQYAERTLKEDGTFSNKPVSAADRWIKWPYRNEAERLTYAPGQGRFVEEKGKRLYNIWPGWGVEPVRGAVKPFLALVDHLFQEADEGAKDWFLKWCAYPLQNPGVKMFSCAVFHGITHGTGKSLIGYTLGKIYGQNFSEISKVDLNNSFNEWAEAKQFAMGDDVTGSNKRDDADFLKKLITQLELRVNRKYLPSYTVPDCINYFFTANHPDSFFLEDSDRRFFIHEVLAEPREPLFYAHYAQWLNRKKGASFVFQYLLDLDLKGFNPAAPAFSTAAKERMIATVQSDLGEWCRILRDTPEAILIAGRQPLERDIYTSAELLKFYDPEQRTGTTRNGVAREMRKAGFRMLNAGRPVRIDDSVNKYFVVRNHAKWLPFKNIERAKEHIRDTMSPRKKSKF